MSPAYILVLLTIIHSPDTPRPRTDTIPRTDTLNPKLLQTATVTRQTPLIQHQFDKTVLNVDHQITAAGTNALELLRQLPGVQVTPDGQITINGRSGVTVLIDGKPTYLSAEDLAAQLTATPSAAIRQLELMTNPSAKYDAEGTGGIINIVRKRDRAAGLNGSATATIGEGNYPRYSGSVLLGYTTSRYSLYLTNNYYTNKNRSGRDVTADIFNDASLLTRQTSTNNDITTLYSNNTTAGIDWYLSKHTTLTLTGNYGTRRNKDKTNSNLISFDSTLTKTGNESFTALSRDHPNSYTAGMQLTHRIDSSGQEWSFDADYSGFHFRPGQNNTTINDNPAGDFESQTDIFLDQARTLRVIGVRMDYIHPWPGKGKWEAGLKASYVKTLNNSSYYNQLGYQDIIDSSQSDYNINTENINAAYINANRHYKHWNVQAGLRAEQTIMNGQQRYINQSTIQQHYFQLFPSLFAAWEIDSHNSIDLQLGRRIDRADYHELVPFRRPLTPTLFFQGNPYLRPTLTWHGEATWAWRNAVFVTFGYDIDKDYVRTLPFLDANDSTYTRIPINIESAHSWNLDISYNHAITTWWTTNTTASFYQNSFTGSANGFNLGNAGIISLDFNSNNSLTIAKNLTGEIDFETETKRQFVQSTFGAYSVLSIGLRQQLPGKKATLSLNAHNILQTESRTSVDHYLNLDQFSNLLIYSRAVTLTFNYRFGSDKPSQTKRRSGSEDEQQRAGN